MVRTLVFGTSYGGSNPSARTPFPTAAARVTGLALQPKQRFLVALGTFDRGVRASLFDEA